MHFRYVLFIEWPRISSPALRGGANPLYFRPCPFDCFMTYLMIIFITTRLKVAFD